MRNQLLFYLIFLITAPIFSGCKKETGFKIYLANASDEREILAARELRRYIYLRSDVLVPIENINLKEPGTVQGIIVGRNKNRDLLSYLPDSLLSRSINLSPEGYVLYAGKTLTGTLGIIAGADPQGVLFGAYRFLEKLGCRFYLHGDVIPDRKMNLVLPEFSEIRTPLFSIRGILPFHDFPEGPDWWNPEDYNHFIAQLPKLQMNFIGFHTYPESGFSGAYKAEPLVWIGTEDQILENGSVSSAYPLLHFNTGDTTWGYLPVPTSQYSGGASLLFEKDRFGASYLPDLSPWPHSHQENIDLVNQLGTVLKRSFSLANRLGVHTCIGTETPLTIPDQTFRDLRNKYPGVNPDSLTRILYRGMFQRIMQTHPLDYYWFWTPENWTWSAVNDQEVENTRQDLQIAWQEAEELQAPFTLATCGWVLGPPRDRTEFDNWLPKNSPFSCINRYVGFARIESAFNRISERPLWAIPWLEDDPGLLSPQLWAGRMRKDALDAYTYGCNGLIGIHWRTRMIGPALAALAQAGWDLTQDTLSGINPRDLPVEDFYDDWAIHEFGDEKGKEIGQLFCTLDGGPEFFPEDNKPYEARLFRTSEWIKGPGAISVIHAPWSEISDRFGFIEKMESFRNDITGAGNMARFDYWLNTFLFARETAKFGCILSEMDKFVQKIKMERDKLIIDSAVRYELLPLRIKATETYNRMMQFLLSTVTNSSELGTVANLEQHNLRSLNRLTFCDSIITHVLKETLPASAIPGTDYTGPSRLILQTPVSLLERDEDLYLKVRILSPDKVDHVNLYWKELGGKEFNTSGFIPVARNVYEVTLNKSSIKNRDLEYFVEAYTDIGERLVYPAAAGETNQTLVIF